MMCCQCLMTVIKQKKKMSQFITLSKHFHGQAYHKKPELRLVVLGGFDVVEMCVVFLV